jgi:Flp pilus assembly pilin Flp
MLHPTPILETELKLPTGKPISILRAGCGIPKRMLGGLLLNQKGWLKMVNSKIKAFFYEEDGQDMVEYSLLLAFIALAAVGLLSGIKTQISGLWSTISSTLSSTNTAAS